MPETFYGKTPRLIFKLAEKDKISIQESKNRSQKSEVRSQETE